MVAKAFFSFHYDGDVIRVQQIRNIGSVSGEQPVEANKWEDIKRKGDQAIKDWIENHLGGKECVIVLIGNQTSTRKWVTYEIRRAWERNIPVFGIYIHNLNDFQGKKSSKGKNPFDNIARYEIDGKVVNPLTFDPKADDTYNDIAANIDSWITAAKKQQQ